MAKIRILLYKSNKRKNGSYPVCMRITQQGKVKYIDLQLSATEEQWNEDTDRFKKDRRINSEYEKYNALLNHYEERKDDILRQFAEQRINWTLSQFEERFLGMPKKGKLYDYFKKRIEEFKLAGHIGNAKVYEKVLQSLMRYDKKLKERLFSEIDIRYINKLDLLMERNHCCGNTRKINLKTLRAVMNKAIEEKEASSNTYPFGKGGFKIDKLTEETEKRYLRKEEFELIKNSPQDNFILERARRLFLFSYYCFGMSFVDVAHLTQGNIKLLESGEYIVYKRSKTQNSKAAKPIKIPITDTIKDLLDWFKQNTPLTGDYLLPVVTKKYFGEQLYDHIRTRYKRINNDLKKLGRILGIKNLTTYVSRHTMAMMLQGQEVPREIISQVMGHTDLATTNTYLDSFETNVTDKVAQLL